VEYGPIPGAHLHAVYASDGCVHPAAGASGGLSGGCAAQYRRDAGGTLEPQGPMGPIEIESGESIVCVGSGGGGYGEPWKRSPARVEKDVREGWITPARARDVYGIAFDAEGGIDAAASSARRSELAGTALADDARSAHVGPRVI
jgi:N-methylhydantoinase B